MSQAEMIALLKSLHHKANSNMSTVVGISTNIEIVYLSSRHDQDTVINYMKACDTHKWSLPFLGDFGYLYISTQQSTTFICPKEFVKANPSTFIGKLRKLICI